MPELPEVEYVVGALKQAALVGKKLLHIKIICPKVSQDLNALIGRKLIHLSRRGKYIHFVFSESIHFVVHLRMTGQFLFKTDREPIQKHERIVFDFEGTILSFHDTRRFGTFQLTKDPQNVFEKLGPEPFDPQMSPLHFFNRLSNKNKAIKSMLLDQSVVAGIGNIYADEALWAAKIHPERQSSSLTKNECRNLLKMIQRVLREGIENG